MATGSAYTDDGKNILLNRLYNATPDYNASNYFAIGIGTTTPAESDTDMEAYIPITGTEIIDNCDAADWTQGGAGDNEVIDTSTYKQGTGALRLPKNNSGAVATWEKTTTSLDGTNKTLYLWLYIKDSTALSKLSTTGCIEIRFGSDSSNYYYFSKDKADLSTGWNLLYKAISDMSTTGSPVITALDYSQIRITTTNATDTFIDDDIIMDYWQLASTDDFYKIWITGYPVFDEDNKKVQVRGILTTSDANGFLISEVGEFNDDSAKKLISHHVITNISKSSTDEVQFVFEHSLE